MPISHVSSLSVPVSIASGVALSEQVRTVGTTRIRQRLVDWGWTAGARPLGFDFPSIMKLGVLRPCAPLQGRVAMLTKGFISNSRAASAVPAGLGSIFSGV